MAKPLTGPATYQGGYEAGQAFVAALLATGLPTAPVALDVDLDPAPLSERKAWALGFAEGARVTAIDAA